MLRVARGTGRGRRSPARRARSRSRERGPSSRMPSGRVRGRRCRCSATSTSRTCSSLRGSPAHSASTPERSPRGVASCPQVPGRMDGSSAPRIRTRRRCSSTMPTRPMRSTSCCTPCDRSAPDALITVFGCGGDRDRAKRPLMAEAVAAFGDLAIATSDNPRTEDPRRDPADVEVGLRSLRPGEPRIGSAAEAAPYTVVPDRREAINRPRSCSRAPDDTVVLAGKGHEDYQIIGREKLPFDDREEARRALAARSEAMSVALQRARSLSDGPTAVCSPGSRDVVFQGAGDRHAIAAAGRPLRRDPGRAARRPPVPVRRPDGGGGRPDGRRSVRRHGAADLRRSAHRRRRHDPGARRAGRGTSRRLHRPADRDHRQQRQDDHQGDVSRDPVRRRTQPQDPRQPEQRVRPAAHAALAANPSTRPPSWRSA